MISIQRSISLMKNLRDYNDEYEMQTGFPLLNYNQKIEFDKKSYNSFCKLPYL